MNATERIEWLEARRNGIGSSDVAAVLGLSPWKSALSVYLSKVEPAHERAGEMTGPQEWGHRAEPMISAAIMDHHGWKLDKVPTLKHPEFEYLIASPDRVNQDGELIEIKTSARSEGWGEPETADVPQNYWLQTQHQLEVADRETCWVFVLIGGNDFRRYRVPRDPDYLTTVIQPLAAFWNCVETRTPPELDWSHPTTIAALNRLYQPKPGTFTALTDAEANLADEYAMLTATIGEHEARKAELKARMIAAVGEFELGILPDGRQLKRNLTQRKGYTVEPCEYVDFRILKAKGAK